MRKRKVSTDALETLGTIIDEHQKRDAIHLAVEPVIAGEELRPGAHIYVKGGYAYAAYDTDDTPPALGIVDPFLDRPVRNGERFWFVMFPRLVHSLRHVWSHPDFPDESEIKKETLNQAVEVLKSVDWMTKLAREIPKHIPDDLDEPDQFFTYDELMQAAKDYLDKDEWFCIYGTEYYLENPVEFWKHYQTITGRTVPGEQQGTFFRCTC